MEKTSIISIVVLVAVQLLLPRIAQAQGTTYLSNVGQPSVGSLAVGNDSWRAALFETGTNASGYVLNSFQLQMAGASGNPNSFTVALYTNVSGFGLPPSTTFIFPPWRQL